MREEKKVLWIIDVLILMVSIIFSALFLLGGSGEDAHAAASLLPNIVSAVCILLAITIFVNKAKERSTNKAKFPVVGMEEKSGTDLSAAQASLLTWWWSFTAMTIYFLSILLIGFIGGTFLYILIMPFFMRYRKWKVVVITSAVVTGCMYVSFSVILDIKLPMGILFGT